MSIEQELRDLLETVTALNTAVLQQRKIIEDAAASSGENAQQTQTLKEQTEFLAQQVGERYQKVLDGSLRLESSVQSAVSATNRIYATPSAGVAAVTGVANDMTFAVVDASLHYYTVYQNKNGVATELYKQYAKKYFDELITASSGANPDSYLRVVDEYGYGSFSANADGSFGTGRAMLSPQGLDTELYKIITDPTTENGELMVMDEYGYASVNMPKGTDVASIFDLIGDGGIDVLPFKIQQSAAGVAFAVGDGYGYYAVRVKIGEAVGDTSKLMSDIYQLQVSGGSTVSAGIPNPRLEVTAHRGVHLSGAAAPENSIDAVYMAARAGFRISECDVLQTSDGEFVIMHDGTINRTCRMASDYSAIPTSVSVFGSTLSALRTNYVLASNIVRFRRQIPTLDDYLRACRDCGITPLLELKDTVNMNNASVLAVYNKCVSILGPDNFILECFNPALLDYARTLSSKLRLYYLFSATPTSAQLDNIQAKGGSIFIMDSLVTTSLVADLRARGIRLVTWTVTNARFDPLLKLGVDEFCSDTLAPALNEQQVAYRSYSGANFSGWTHLGSLTDGVLSLAQGQTLTLSSVQARKLTEFGAYYLNFGLKGNVSLSATRLTTTYSNANSDWSRMFAQAMICQETPTIVLTGGSGGCQIKDLALAIANF